MTNLIKSLSPQELQSWNVRPDSKVEYYDGKILVVSDPEPEAPFGVAAKAGTALLFGIAVFTHAPLVGVVFGAYAVAKVLGTVSDLYGGDNALMTRLEQDLGIGEARPALPEAESPTIGNATRLGAVEAPAVLVQKQPTSEELKEVGGTLVDRLSGQKTVLEQIRQRVKSGDIKGGLKMAIEANKLTPETFLKAFPEKGHVYDWADSATVAVIPNETIGQYVDRTPPSRPVEEAIVQAQSQVVPAQSESQWKKPNAEAVNPIDILGSLLSSLLLIAPTGAGKGILISNLIRHFNKTQRGLKVFAFEGKNDPNERGYWAEGFEQVARINLDICDATEAARAITWIISQVDQHHQNGAPSVLLIDEANTLITVLENGSKYGSKENKEECGIALGLTKKKISTAASTGNSAQKYVWVIGQNPNLGALGLNGGDANQLRKVAIAFHRNPVLTDQIVLNTGYTGKKQDAVYRGMIDDLIECSPVDRAFYDSASAQTTDNRGWFPMNKMINYSGYDRDSRKHIGKAPPVEMPELAEYQEAYSLPSEPAQCLELAARLVRESRIISSDEVEELVPGLSRYLPTVIRYYPKCSRQGEVYKWAD